MTAAPAGYEILKKIGSGGFGECYLVQRSIALTDEMDDSEVTYETQTCVLLADRATRGALQQPKPRTSALKVTCFLTKKKIDVGFVCSVCLSIFSTRMASCATCGTTFMTTKALKKRTLAKESKSGAS